jgi:hypothetical protein
MSLSEPGETRELWHPEPIFVLCCARSGSTLLSRLLGSHPDISAPAETNLSAACAALLASCETLERDSAKTPRSIRLAPVRARARVQKVAESIIRAYLTKTGRPVFCDKSLPNELHANILIELFPHSRFIILHRHCMDVVDSLIEASPWGFDGYGASPFITRSPTSFAAGLAEMWLGVTTRQLDFAKTHSENVVSVRYEDMVADPRRVMADVYCALGLSQTAWTDRASEAIVTLPRVAPRGPADYKIAFTETVETGSVGRGRRIPLMYVPVALREALNEKLCELGYAALDESWNTAVVPRVRNGIDVQVSAANFETPMERREWSISMDAITEVLASRILGRGRPGVRARLAIEDLGCTLVADFGKRTIAVESGISDPLYSSSIAGLLGTVLGGINLGSALRRGELRLCRTKPEMTVESEALLELLASPLAEVAIERMTATAGSPRVGSALDG